MKDTDKQKIKTVVGEILNPHPNAQTLHFVMIVALMFIVALAAFSAGVNMTLAEHTQADDHFNKMVVMMNKNHTFDQNHLAPPPHLEFDRQHLTNTSGAF